MQLAFRECYPTLLTKSLNRQRNRSVSRSWILNSTRIPPPIWIRQRIRRRHRRPPPPPTRSDTAPLPPPSCSSQDSPLPQPQTLTRAFSPSTARKWRRSERSGGTSHSPIRSTDIAVSYSWSRFPSCWSLSWFCWCRGRRPPSSRSTRWKVAKEEARIRGSTQWSSTRGARGAACMFTVLMRIWISFLWRMSSSSSFRYCIAKTDLNKL